MILMSNAMMGAAGYQAASGSGHPNLYWAFPFWLQTGREEAVSGQTMGAYTGSPTQQANGMSFDGNDALLCPGPIPGGPKTIIAKVLDLSASTLQNYGIIDDCYNASFGSAVGSAIVLRRKLDDTSLLVVPGACSASKGNTGALTDFDIALSYGVQSLAYFNGATAFRQEDACQEEQSLETARIGVYFDDSAERFFVGTLAFLYVFDKELTPAEISAVFADPQSVLP